MTHQNIVILQGKQYTQGDNNDTLVKMNTQGFYARNHGMNSSHSCLKRESVSKRDKKYIVLQK